MLDHFVSSNFHRTNVSIWECLFITDCKCNEFSLVCNLNIKWLVPNWCLSCVIVSVCLKLLFPICDKNIGVHLAHHLNISFQTSIYTSDPQNTIWTVLAKLHILCVTIFRNLTIDELSILSTYLCPVFFAWNWLKDDFIENFFQLFFFDFNWGETIITTHSATVSLARRQDALVFLDSHFQDSRVNCSNNWILA